MDIMDKRVRQIERLAKEKKTLSPSSKSFVDRRGETALSRYTRLSRLDSRNQATVRRFIGTVRYFLSNGFDPYHADHNGEYPFTHLLGKLPFGTKDINNMYVAFLKKLLDDFPPPAYNAYAQHRLRHPIHVLFRLIRDMYDTDMHTITSITPLSKMMKTVLRRFDMRNIDHDEYMNYIRSSLDNEYHIFIDTIVSSRREDTRLTDEDFMVILNTLIDNRSWFRPTDIDDLDDEVLREALSKTDTWNQSEMFLRKVATGNDMRAKRVVFSLLQRARDRNFFLEVYMMSATSCVAIDLDFLRYMLEAKTKVVSAMCLNDIVANDCKNVMQLLCDYSALSKRVIQELLESADKENNTTRFLHDILLRHTIVIQHSEKPNTARVNNPLATLNPDVSRMLASFMLK